MIIARNRSSGTLAMYFTDRILQRCFLRKMTRELCHLTKKMLNQIPLTVLAKILNNDLFIIDEQLVKYIRHANRFTINYLNAEVKENLFITERRFPCLLLHLLI